MTLSGSVAEGPPGPGGPLVAGLCRVTIHGPGRSFDLALPTDVPIADMVPTIIGHAGDALDEAGLGHGGWALQRLGEDPLSSSRTPAELDLHDGEVLYLRAHRDALPPVHFDDLVDGVMHSLIQRPDSWRPELSRRLLLGTMVAVLGTVLVVLPMIMSAVPAAANAMVIAVVLYGAASVAVRAFDDSGVGHLLALCGLAALTLAVAELTEGSGLIENHARLLAAGAAFTAGAALGLACTGRRPSLYLSFGTAGLLVLLAGTLTKVSYEHTAAVVACVIVLLLLFMPGWAFWLSGLRLPPLPANAEQLQEGIDPHSSELVALRAAVADGYLTALLAASGTVYAVAVSVVALTANSPSGLWMAGLLSCLAILHGRTLGGVWQRLSVVIPGLVGGAALLVNILQEVERHWAVAAVHLMWAGALGLAFASGTIPGRRMIPHWARAAEIAHTLLAAALLPLLLLCLGLFSFLRGLGG